MIDGERPRVWVTPCLNHERFDEVWWQSLDDALDYIHDHLAEHISCKVTEQEIIDEGFVFRLESKLVDREDYVSVFDGE